MHEDENYLCPFPERKMEVFRLSKICKVRLGPEKDIYDNAKFFLTCDDDLIKQSKRLKLDIEVMNPVDYIRGCE